MSRIREENLEPIYSNLADDEDLGELVSLFVEEMPGRVATLESHFGNGDFESLCRVAHQLKGSVGSYGFEPLTEYAAALERSIRQGERCEVIQQALVELLRRCSAIRPGVPPN